MVVNIYRSSEDTGGPWDAALPPQAFHLPASYLDELWGPPPDYRLSLRTPTSTEIPHSSPEMSGHTLTRISS